jgi:hypothetical protein
MLNRQPPTKKQIEIKKFPKFSGITTLTCIGIIMYTITQSDKHNAAAVGPPQK